MSNKKNPGEAANVEELKDGSYVILSTVNDIRESVANSKPFIIRGRDPVFIFIRIKTEDAIFNILLDDLTKFDFFEVEKGKIIKIN